MTESLSRAIGNIEGKLDRLIKDSDHANEKRAEQYKRFEAIERRLEAYDKMILNIDKRLENVEKPVSDFNRWRERAIGAVMFVSMVAALVGGTVATYWQKITMIFK